MLQWLWRLVRGRRGEQMTPAQYARDIENPRSFDDYRIHLREQLESLSNPARLRFCIWCVERFPSEFGEVVWDGLTADERRRTLEIIQRLRAAATANTFVAPAEAHQLKAEMDSFGPHDEIESIEVEPDAIEFMSALWSTIEFCCTLDVTHVCNVSEGLVNSWDHRIEGEDASYTLENMFTFPELRRELQLQIEQIAQLRASEI